MTNMFIQNVNQDEVKFLQDGFLKYKSEIEKHFTISDVVDNFSPEYVVKYFNV